jgi:hypothetical protein
MIRSATTTANRQVSAAVAMVALAALHAAACATIVRGTEPTQPVLVTSVPAGAHVFLGSQPVGVTPVTLDLKRRDSHIVLRLEKDGFAPERVPVRQSFSGWMALDLFPLNPYIGQGMSSSTQQPTKGQRAGVLALAFAIDVLSGAAYTLPAVLQVSLTPVR